MKKLVLVLILSALASEACATINASGRLLLSPSIRGSVEQKALLPIDMTDVGIGKSPANGELFFNYLEKDYSIRMFYTPPVTLTGNGKLIAGQYTPLNDKDTFRLVTSKFTHSDARLELGMPLKYERTCIEPQAVATWSDADIEVRGKSYHLVSKNTSSHLGVGLQASTVIGSNALIEGRAAVMGNGYSAEGSYYWFNKGKFFSAGYFTKKTRLGDLSINVSGPMIGVGLMF